MQVAQDRAAQKTQLKDPLPSASLLPPLLKENNFFSSAFAANCL